MPNAQNVEKPKISHYILMNDKISTSQNNEGRNIEYKISKANCESDKIYFLKLLRILPKYS